MLPHLDRYTLEKSPRKVSVLRNFIKICLNLVKYEKALRELDRLVDESEEEVRQERTMNHIHNKIKTWRCL